MNIYTTPEKANQSLLFLKKKRNRKKASLEERILNALIEGENYNKTKKSLYIPIKQYHERHGSKKHKRMTSAYTFFDQKFEKPKEFNSSKKRFIERRNTQ